MKNNVSINSFTFSEEELNKRVTQAQNAFLRSYGSVDRLDGPAAIIMPQLEKLFKEGRTLSKYHAVNTDRSLTVYLEKEDISDLLEDVAKKTKTDYLAQLEQEKGRQQALLANQLFQSELQKEQRKKDDHEAKLKAKAAKEAKEYFQSLEEQ
ncbi:hypothetical protein [Pseudomonas sp. PDM20]|uniref:hypothetical protein n=1 Tax=Pseudomonas sp. PDM20 TaxID=2769254 RepID=UPI001783B615|nr:hypothetical protein [Pseudomonas sp. PDM20]MBD9681438.1 hypothetical protein [Pseudomonas sp. PDM20]